MPFSPHCHCLTVIVCWEATVVQFLLSLLVAVMVYVPGVVDDQPVALALGAVRVPPVAVHVTAVLAALATVAVRLTDWPGVRLPEAGFLVVETVMLGTVMVTVADLPSQVG